MELNSEFIRETLEKRKALLQTALIQLLPLSIEFNLDTPEQQVYPTYSFIEITSGRGTNSESSCVYRLVEILGQDEFVIGDFKGNEYQLSSTDYKIMRVNEGKMSFNNRQIKKV